MLGAIGDAWSLSVCGISTTNSSPPRRAGKSVVRSSRRHTSAVAMMVLSPARWPCWSLMILKLSISKVSTELEMLGQAAHQLAAVGQPGQRVGLALHAQQRFQLLAGGDVAGHPEYCILAHDLIIQRLHAAFKPDGLDRAGAADALDVVRRQRVFDHVQSPRRQRNGDLRLEPGGFLRVPDLADVLADQAAAIVVIAAVSAAKSYR